MADWRRRTVSNGSIDLAVFELGDESNPTVVLVHGWPDTHHLWTHVAPAIAAAGYHVAAYDTRGYGETSAPDGDAPYRLADVATDLFAVADAVSPDAPVHVVAHDWGSVQTWEAVTTPGAEKRIKSFVSVSGPNLDYLSEWARKNLARPTPANLAKAFSQLGSSAYTGFFQAPVLPNLFWRAAGRPGLWREFLHRIEGTPKDNVVLGDTFTADTISGLRYYRANIRQKLADPEPRPTKVPVLEIVNERDVALRPTIYDYTHTHAENLWRRNSSTGHWLPYTNPDYLVATALDFIDSLEGRSGNRPATLDRARVLSTPGKLTGKLAVITGAGSGIGRETAYALAERGCEIVIADLDFDSAEATAINCKALGAQAHSYDLDVSDVAAFNAFAATVAAKHGVADIVVNNAGVGLGGSALAATDEQLDRVLAINLRGVMTGCRAFGRQMVERGIGGNIINIASAAAFTPQKGLGIYAASKAGVLLFSESLRAELAEHRIGVTAICPGIVNTNIVSNTPLAGFDDDAVEQEHRDRLDSFYQRRNFGPEKVARDIVAALEANKAVAPVTPEAKLGYRVYRFTPWLARLMARGDILR
ncbi:SDR family oxidoreductase [Gordonia asplenii]|nr:SDR family oxidoreductase [Gordonia asplenii]